MMTSQFFIRSFAAISMKPIPDIADGQPFIDGDVLCVISTINTYTILLPLTGQESFRARDNRSPARQVVPMYDGQLSTEFIQHSPVIKVTSDLNLRGHVAMLMSGQVGICADLAGAHGDKGEPGRSIFFPKSGEAEFHDRELRFAIASWELIWRDKEGRPVLSLFRSDPAVGQETT